MKILDIINLQEAGFRDAFLRGLEKGAGKTASPADRAIAGAEKGATQAPAAAEKGAAKQGTWEKWGTWVDKELAQEGDKAVAAALKTKVITHFNTKVAGFVDFLGWANITGWVAWYWFVAKPKLDKEYQSRAIDENTYQQRLTELRGKIIAQVIAPRIALKLAEKVGVNWIVSRVPWILNFFGAKNSALALKGLGTAAGSTAAYAYFSSPAGQKFLSTDFLGAVSLGLGVSANVVDNLVSSLISKPAEPASGLTYTGPSAAGAKQDIDATSSEPVFGQSDKNIKFGDRSKGFF